MRFALCIALVVTISACAPATSSYDAAEATRVFTLLVDGQTVPSAGDAFTYRSEAFDLDVVLDMRHFRINLVNNTDSTMRLMPDRSAIVLPDGTSSNVVGGTVSWITRNDPQPTIVIPQAARATEILVPRSSLRFLSGPYGGLYTVPMFPWPLSSTVTMRLVLALEIEGSEREIVLAFEGTPQPNP